MNKKRKHVWCLISKKVIGTILLSLFEKDPFILETKTFNLGHIKNLPIVVLVTFILFIGDSLLIHLIFSEFQ